MSSYSVPSRLIGQRVRVERYEAELKVVVRGELVLQLGSGATAEP